MSRQRLLMLTVAALVAIFAALALTSHRNASPDLHGAALLPSLGAELDTVTSLSVLKGSPTPTVTVHKQGDQWTVAQRGDYPADASKVRKLLLALSDAKIGEEKTSNPDNYSVIGVEDALKAGATGSQIELLAKSGKLDIIVGKPMAQGNFVRRAAEKTSYVAEPSISFEAEPRFWIDTRLLDIANEKIQSIEFKPASGPGYTLRRVTEPAAKAAEGKAASPPLPGAPPATAQAPGAEPAPEAATATPAPVSAPPVSKFVLEGVPSGRQANDAQSIAPLPSTFSSFTVEDVSPASDVDFSKPSILVVTLTDGSVMTLTGTAAGDKRWIQVAAPKDAALTAKANGRAFEVASYRYDQVFRPLEQLLVPKPAPPSAKPATGEPRSSPIPSPIPKKPPTTSKP
jgi:Domain of unknown function (DUF4340)